MNKSAFTLVIGLCLVGLTAWAGPSLWRAHHGSSRCCGMAAITEDSCCPVSTCCEATASTTCEAKEGTCSAGSMICTEGLTESGICEFGCESAMPCTEPGEKFVHKKATKAAQPARE